tara:strand:- start:2329 stop:2538 length:210 start_codon:yes stop_codon:yes gene_type:complete
MKDINFGKLVLGGSIILAIIIMFSSCVFAPTVVNPEGPWYSEQFLEENPEYLEESYKCSKYYENEAKKE